MTNCVSCGHDVTGKKFCPECGTSVSVNNSSAQGISGHAICPHCRGEVKVGAAFCMHCGSALSASAPVTPPPAMRPCPACQTLVPSSTIFCTQCGHDMRVVAASQNGTSMVFCTSCGKQNAPGVRFCGSCGSSLAPATAQPAYTAYNPYPQASQQTPQYSQQYPPAQQYPPSQQYPQQYPQQYNQGGYQQQPMMGQQPMVLRCPTCMAMAPLGTQICQGCRTNLAGVVPSPANMPMQGQQGGMNGFLQGSGGKMAMGALGGAAAVIGGEMLLHGFENSIEDRVEGDMGMGGGFGHRHHRRDEGMLGGLGQIADDIGLI